MDKINLALKNVKLVRRGIRLTASESSQKIIEKLVADSDEKIITALIEYGSEMYNSGVVDGLIGVIIGGTTALIVGGGILIYKNVKIKKKIKADLKTLEDQKI